MGEGWCYLVTVLYKGGPIKCAIKVEPDMPQHMDTGPAKDWLHDRLPPHVQSMGPVIDFERIHEVEDQVT